jgi:hypothetical protein
MEQKVSEQEKLEIMRNIETKTEKFIINATRKGLIEVPSFNNNSYTLNADTVKIEQSTEVLTNIMKLGAEEFKSKVGRNMTYSEMRQMYG